MILNTRPHLSNFTTSLRATNKVWRCSETLSPTFLAPRMSSMRVAVCRKVFLLFIRVKRNSTKSSRAARLLVTPSVWGDRGSPPSVDYVYSPFHMNHSQVPQWGGRDELIAYTYSLYHGKTTLTLKRLMHTYTHTAVVKHTKAVLHQVIIH